MIESRFGVVLIGMLALSGTATVATESQTAQLTAIHGSAVQGSATLHEIKGPTVVVVVKMTGSRKHSQAAEIRPGTCGHIGEAIAYQLSALRNGTATTTIEHLELGDLGAKPYVLVVHSSAAGSSNLDACAQLQGE